MYLTNEMNKRLFLVHNLFIWTVVGTLLFLFTVIDISDRVKKPKILERDKTFGPLAARYWMTNETGMDLSKKTENIINTWNPYCVLHSKWYRRYPFRAMTSNLSSWTYDNKIDCLALNVSHLDFAKTNSKFSFTCSSDKTIINFVTSDLKRTLSNDDVTKVPFGDQCLKRYIDSCCTDDLPVPNVVHYVRYGKGELGFFEFVSFISVIRFVRPCAILIHGDALPNGTYWNYILALSPNIIHVYRKPPDAIFGRELVHKTHASDLMRIEALLEYGGIYIDTDTVFVNSVETLRKYPCTMSQQSRFFMSSAFIMAKRNAEFLQKWLYGYKRHYNYKSYVHNAMIYPKNLALKYKHLINNVYGKLSRPSTQIGYKVYVENYNWSSIYGMHLFSRNFVKTMNETLVGIFNSTVGSIVRHILLGNKELCKQQSRKSAD